MRIVSTLATLLAAVAMAGCNTVMPIQNVDNASVAASANKPLSQAQVHDAIIRAGAALGWIMKDVGPGRIGGTLMLRTHTAEVEIPFSETSYSIRYKRSVDLQESNGKIHRNYNGWITNLTRGINAQLAATS